MGLSACSALGSLLTMHTCLHLPHRIFANTSKGLWEVSCWLPFDQDFPQLLGTTNVAKQTRSCLKYLFEISHYFKRLFYFRQGLQHQFAVKNNGRFDTMKS